MTTYRPHEAGNDIDVGMRVIDIAIIGLARWRRKWVGRKRYGYEGKQTSRAEKRIGT